MEKCCWQNILLWHSITFHYNLKFMLAISADQFGPIYQTLSLFKCKRYGHFNTTCRGFLNCALCAYVGHVNKYCEKPELCAHYESEHTSYSRTKKYLRLKLIEIYFNLISSNLLSLETHLLLFLTPAYLNINQN